MPFNFGLHPAFNCPLEEGKAFDAYHLELNQKEVVDDQEVDVIVLDKDALKKTIIIQNPRSTCTKLTDGTHGVQVEYQGYPWLAYWSPYAPFICIEPWYSHTDFEKNEVPFEKREGTILLDVNDSWQTAYSITLF
jgi:aldose 1-epimerase